MRLLIHAWIKLNHVSKTGPGCTCSICEAHGINSMNDGAQVYRKISFTKCWDDTGSSRYSWWRHQMETVSALLAICAGNSPVSGEFPAQRPVTRGFDVFFDLRPDKQLSKQSWGWWFETPSHSFWRHRNVPGLLLLSRNQCVHYGDYQFIHNKEKFCG